MHNPSAVPVPTPAPAPDDIGRELAARLRKQVLANSAAEAAHTPEHTAPLPSLRTHLRLYALRASR